AVEVVAAAAAVRAVVELQQQVLAAVGIGDGHHRVGAPSVLEADQLDALEGGAAGHGDRRRGGELAGREHRRPDAVRRAARREDRRRSAASDALVRERGHGSRRCRGAAADFPARDRTRVAEDPVIGLERPVAGRDRDLLERRVVDGARVAERGRHERAVG
ncbi:MAG: hypothetical protein ACK55I_30525, partial [bacterium]